MEFNQEWDVFTRRIFINIPIEKVYNAWAVQGEMEEWFLRKAQFSSLEGVARKRGERVQSEDTYSWIWHTWPEFDQKGEIFEAERPNKLSFSFGPAGRVDIEFTANGPDRTEVAITQSEIPTDEKSKKSYFYGCSLGWSFWLVNLKAYLEHGILLDERDVIYSDNRHMDIVNH